MLTFVIALHVVVCVFLAIFILMQSGRGGGLTEQFAAAESVFGANTNVFLVKATSVLAAFFIMTCLSLAFLSSQKDKSLMSGKIAPVTTPTLSQPQPAPVEKPQEASLEESQETTPEEPKELAPEAGSTTETIPEQKQP